MPDRPDVIVFDVNETLSDMGPMGQRFADVGAPPELAKLWFASLLRDGFALTAAGGQERFAVLAEDVLRSLLAAVRLDRDVDEAVDHVLTGMSELEVHPDVPDGLRRLRQGGSRLVTLSNGATSVADSLLTRAGVRDQLEELLSVEDATAWKPAGAAYRWAAERCGVALEDMMLVAVHPWDVDGAARAGVRTAWLDRRGTAYPSYFTPPELTASSLRHLGDLLG
jgi:2-haloacid dehalogenase